MATPKGYVNSEYLELAAEMLAPLKHRTYTLMELQTGDFALDVGCGPGKDTLPLAHIVGPSGHVLGVDYDAEMIAQAQESAQMQGVSKWVEHRQADATQLPLEANRVDASRSERMLLHVPDPAAVIAEMRRVTRPGGQVVVADTDWAKLSYDTHETDIERRLVRYKAEHTVLNGYSGRRLYGLFRQQGFNDLHVEIFDVYSTDLQPARYLTRLGHVEGEALKAGVVSQDELDRWHADLQAAADRGQFFCSWALVIVSGRVP